VLAPGQPQRALERLGELHEQRLGELHQVGVVRVRLVELEHRELGVVLRRDPLVAEAPVDLVHALEAAHDEALEVQLGRDAQVEVHPERVVVGPERPRDRAAGDRLHHRRLDLEEAARLEEGAERAHEPRAQPEDLARLRVDDQVHVPLAVARLHVLEAVPLLGQWPERLGEERERLDRHRQLAGPRPEQLARDADEVAEVEVGEARVLVAELVGARVELEVKRAYSSPSWSARA